MRIRAVLDKSVLVAGASSGSGASREILRLAWEGEFDWLASGTLIFEYEAALKKPKNLRASGLSAEEVDNLLDAICHLISPVVYGVVRPRRPFSPDPGDDHVIEVAVQGCADWLVTLN